MKPFFSPQRIAVSAFALYVLSVAYTIVSILSGSEPPPWLLSSTTLLFFLFAVSHATVQLGVRSMLIFLGITFSVSLGFETIGVLTGLIYGPYYYTDRLGIKLGVVPVLIPLAWFMMIYASYAIVRAFADPSRQSFWRVVWLAVLGAMATTAWDLGMDPQMVARGHWVWTAGGAYFGIPVHNFVGWLATTFTVFLLYLGYERTQSPRAWQFTQTFPRLPIVTYAVQGMVTIIAALAAEQRALAMITFFAMGAFLLTALTRITFGESR